RSRCHLFLYSPHDESHVAFLGSRREIPALNRAGRDSSLGPLALEVHMRSTTKRRSRIGCVPGARATALALAGILAVGGQAGQAAPAAPADKPDKPDKAEKAAAAAKNLAAAKEEATKAAAAAEAAAKVPIPVLEGGRVVGQKTQRGAQGR